MNGDGMKQYLDAKFAEITAQINEAETAIRMTIMAG
jgi:hypothetical protein